MNNQFKKDFQILKEIISTKELFLTENNNPPKDENDFLVHYFLSAIYKFSTKEEVLDFVIEKLILEGFENSLKLKFYLNEVLEEFERGK